MDENTSWAKQLLVVVGLLVAMGLLVGGVFAVLTLKAADVAGVGDPQAEDTEPPPGLTPSATTTPEETAARSKTPSPTRTRTPTSTPTETVAPTRTTTPPTTTTATPTTTPPTTTGNTPPNQAIVLNASPQRVGTYERIDLSGRATGGAEGTTLQVQRLEAGGWANFPVRATVSGGGFATYIETGVVGLNRFRVLDLSTGRASNVVLVRVS